MNLNNLLIKSLVGVKDKMITDEELENSILRYQEKARKKGWDGKLIWEVLDARESHDYIKSIGRQLGRKEKEQEFEEKAVDEKIKKAKEEELIEFKEYLEFLLSNRLHPEYSIKDLRIEIVDQLGLVYSRITKLTNQK